MRSAIFITARTKSTRLPKKVLIEIEGRKVIEHLIDRVKLAKLPDLIVLCTSTNPNDACLIDIAKQEGIEWFRGSEDDVLDRFSRAAIKFNIDFLVVTWGDELFCDPEYIDKMIEYFKKTNADFIKGEDLPLGTFTYGLKVDALKKICKIKKDTNTEVWGEYFTYSDIFTTQNLPINDEKFRHPEIRMTLDYPKDLLFIKELFKRLYKKGKVFSLRKILRLLKKHPELMDINRECQKKYEARIKAQAKRIPK